ncbi:hypothetical protein P5V15_008382 [Pogonomyrmex californicus]
MLVLNEAKHTQRDNASFTKKTSIDNTRSSGCIKKRKKLNATGKLTKNRVVDGFDVVLGNNFVAFMFDEIRYELDSVEIDRNRNVGITSTLKHYVTTSSDRSVILRNAD